MHLLHHHHKGGKTRCGKVKQEPAHYELVCYECGREFMERKGILHRSKLAHCPVCHEKSIETSGTSGKHGRSFTSPFKSKSFHRLLASFHKKNKVVAHSMPVGLTAPSSMESAGIQRLECGKMSAGEDICSDREDQCPFAFTYETEEVESYQSYHYDFSEGVESYQMEWLLSDV